MKAKIFLNWIIIFLIFFPHFSYSNEKFSDICIFQNSILENDGKKCFYKCNKKLRFFVINKNEKCYSDLKIIGKRNNSKIFNNPKFNFGFSTFDGASIGIGLEIK